MPARRMAVGRRLLQLLLVAAALAVPAGSAAAQQSEGAGAAPTSQAVISADEISYDESLQSVVASGNVEIAHGERILLAEAIRYDQRNDSVIATGNVVILEPTGEVMFADYVELSDELRSGVIENIKILLADNSRLAANGARRINGRKTIMKRAVFSPCRICEDDPARPPLWQLKAGTIVHDQESQNIEYTNAWLEMFGVPVVYTPYLMHPDPMVERRSGLLTPQFGASTIFGGFARLPIYLVFNESSDATIEPILTIKERPILAFEYRQRLNNGAMEFSASATKADRETGDPDNPTIIEDTQRGHLFAAGRFDLDEDWRWGFDLQRASDPTYLDRYDFFGEPGDILESNLYVEGFHRRSYTEANIFAFQNLGSPDPLAVDEPLVAPILDHNYMSEADSIGGRWAFDADVRNHVRQEGTDSRRLSLKGGYMIPLVADFGLVTTLSASIEADAYHYDQLQLDGQLENNVTAGRVVPRLAAEWRLPIVRGTEHTRQ
ncbi:MAG: LPS assembly protein LptD, partial [Gammaproteobacteria bacterium]|nr:LPS assembly protein LptD [Gammaproteobacteria bacterium]